VWSPYVHFGDVQLSGTRGWWFSRASCELTLSRLYPCWHSIRSAHPAHGIIFTSSTLRWPAQFVSNSNSR
jgi:hypothetical protein